MIASAAPGPSASPAAGYGYAQSMWGGRYYYGGYGRGRYSTSGVPAELQWHLWECGRCPMSDLYHHQVQCTSSQTGSSIAGQVLAEHWSLTQQLSTISSLPCLACKQ